MHYKLHEIEAGEKFFYHVDKHGQGSIEAFGVRLSENVCPEKLLKATQKAINCFPLFKLRPVITQDGEVYLIENEIPVKVYAKKQGTKVLGTDEANGYMFRITYENDFIYIYAHHSLGDGKTILGFLMTTVYYYLKEQGIEVNSEGKLYTEECLDNPTLLDSFLTDIKKVEIKEKTDNYTPQNVFDYVGYVDEKNGNSCYHIWWDNREMKKRISEIGVTPTPFMAAIMSEAFNNLAKVGDQNIVVGIPVDMRSKMKSISQRNYIGNIRIPFYPEWAKLPLEEKAHKLKELIEIQTDTNNIISRAKNLGIIVEKIVNMPLIQPETQKKSENKNNKDGAVASTYTISNIGVLSTPKDMKLYIKDFTCPISNTRERDVFLLMYTMDNQSSIILSQPFQDTKLVNEICRLLNEQNIHTKFNEHKISARDTVDVNRFMKI